MLCTTLWIAAALALIWVIRRAIAIATRKPVAGEVVFISGGGSGIGRQMSLRFAKLGAKVVVADINKEAAERVANEITRANGAAMSVECNVANSESVRAAADAVRARFGDVTILVNNAGIVSGKPLLELSDEQINRTFQVNSISHYYTARAFLPKMIERNHGHIVTIASAAAHVGVVKMTDYCASKSAAFAFDESLRMELSNRGLNGVRTTCVCPFFINTGMFDGVKSRFPLLLPILDENYVADKIIRSVRENQAVLCMPRLVYATTLMRALLPTAVFDAVSNLLGTNASMDDFVGRRPVAVADKKSS